MISIVVREPRALEVESANVLSRSQMRSWSRFAVPAFVDQMYIFCTAPIPSQCIPA